MPSTERLFLALWPPPSARAALSALAMRSTEGIACKRIPERQIHVTLAFLGDTSADQRHQLEAHLERIKAAPFALTLDRVERPPRSDILWASPSDTPRALTALAGSVSAAGGACGLHREERRYRAHVTLARRFKAPAPDVAMIPISWIVEGFSLVRSTLTSEGPIYEDLRRFALRR